MNHSQTLPPSVARVACEDKLQSHQTSPDSKLDDHGGGIIPDNVEEIIEAYMRREIARIHRHNSYAHLTIYLSEYHDHPSKIHCSCYCGEVLKDQTGSSLAECVDKQINRIANHNPAKELRDQAEELLKRAAQIESERGAL